MMSLGLYTETRLWFQNLSITFWSENVKTSFPELYWSLRIFDFTQRNPNVNLRFIHVIGVCLTSQLASEKHNQEKSPQTFAHLVNLSKQVSAMFDNHTILLFSLQNKQSNFSHVLTVIVCFVLFSNQGGKKNHTVGHERHEVCREAMNESAVSRDIPLFNAFLYRQHTVPVNYTNMFHINQYEILFLNFRLKLDNLGVQNDFPRGVTIFSHNPALTSSSGIFLK